MRIQRRLTAVITVCGICIGACVAILAGCGSDGGAEAQRAPRPFEFECDGSEACPEGYCDPFRGCVPCLFDGHCADGERCDERQCRPFLPCLSGVDCADSSLRVCDPRFHACVECATDTECSAGQRCRSNRCEAFTACTSDEQCQTRSGVCDSDSGDCVECVDHKDCETSQQRCAGNRCVTLCAVDQDCESGREHVCGSEGYCTDCRVNTDCPDVYHCADERCTLDVCEASNRSCDRNGNGLITCSDDGDENTLTTCSFTEACVSEAGARCEQLLCEPGEARCDAAGVVAELCSADGLSIVQRVDCSGSGAACVGGECRPRVCDPGVFLCRGRQRFQCSANGAAEELLETCDPTEICNETLGECEPAACASTRADCDENVAIVCHHTGEEPEVEVCESSGEVCWNGECRAPVCRSEYECLGGNSYACADNGTRLALDEVCSVEVEAKEYCNPRSGRCEPVVCEPGEPTCNEEVATVCLDDGSGPATIGVSCAASDSACWQGECLPVVCAQAFSCDEEGRLYGCENNRTALRLVATCGQPQECDASAGRCGGSLCPAGAPMCDGIRAVICNADGDGFEPGAVDCGAIENGCLDGRCSSRVCVPDSLFCRDGNVQRCDSSAARFTLEDACSEFEHCVEGAPTCRLDVCSPGAPTCNGEIATLCRPDGSGPEPGGSDCARSEAICHLGVCKDLTCRPNERFCAAGHVRLCNGSGSSSAPYDTCTASEACDPTPPAQCRAMP